jgi:probable rRNA maturation factor
MTSTLSARPRSYAPPIAAAPEIRRPAMLEVEVFGVELAPDAPPLATVQSLCALAAAAAGVRDGHLAIEYVDAERIAQLNAEHRGKAGPTDVLSFPIDGADPLYGAAPLNGPSPLNGPASQDHPIDSSFSPDGAASIDGPARELGDVVICPEHTLDLREAIVHGVLHLVGLDHETDNGEMLALQAELLKRIYPPGR